MASVACRLADGHADCGMVRHLARSSPGLRAWQAHLAAFPEITVTVEDHQVAVSIDFSDPDGNPHEITT